MSLGRISSLGALARSCLQVQLKRNIAVSAVCCQKLDPIQQMFINQIKDYAKKSKTSGGLVDATEETKHSLQDQLTKLKRQFGADTVDMSKFPTFEFTDPTLESVGLNLDQEAINKAQQAAAKSATEEAVEEEDPDKPYFVL